MSGDDDEKDKQRRFSKRVREKQKQKNARSRLEEARQRRQQRHRNNNSSSSSDEEEVTEAELNRARRRANPDQFRKRNDLIYEQSAYCRDTYAGSKRLKYWAERMDSDTSNECDSSDESFINDGPIESGSDGDDEKEIEPEEGNTDDDFLDDADAQPSTSRGYESTPGGKKRHRNKTPKKKGRGRSKKRPAAAQTEPPPRRIQTRAATAKKRLAKRAAEMRREIREARNEPAPDVELHQQRELFDDGQSQPQAQHDSQQPVPYDALQPGTSSKPEKCTDDTDDDDEPPIMRRRLFESPEPDSQSQSSTQQSVDSATQTTPIKKLCVISDDDDEEDEKPKQDTKMEQDESDIQSSQEQPRVSPKKRSSPSKAILDDDEDSQKPNGDAPQLEDLPSSPKNMEVSPKKRSSSTKVAVGDSCEYEGALQQPDIDEIDDLPATQEPCKEPMTNGFTFKEINGNDTCVNNNESEDDDIVQSSQEQPVTSCKLSPAKVIRDDDEETSTSIAIDDLPCCSRPLRDRVKAHKCHYRSIRHHFYTVGNTIPLTDAEIEQMLQSFFPDDQGNERDSVPDQELMEYNLLYFRQREAERQQDMQQESSSSDSASSGDDEDFIDNEALREKFKSKRNRKQQRALLRREHEKQLRYEQMARKRQRLSETSASFDDSEVYERVEYNHQAVFHANTRGRNDPRRWEYDCSPPMEKYPDWDEEK